MMKNLFKKIPDYVISICAIIAATIICMQCATPAYAQFNNPASTTLTNVTANTGSAYTINPVSGSSFNLTMNSATPTITLSPAPAANIEKIVYVLLIQDGTGGRLPTFSNVTWDTGIPPFINQAAASVTSLTIVASGGTWRGYAAYQGIGVSNGSAASTGYIGETLTSLIASGSAVSLTTATVAPITSLAYTAGEWIVTANPTYTCSGVTGTEYQSFIGTASGTSTTGQTVDNTAFATPFVATTSGISSSSITYRFSTTSSGTLYVKAKATFSIGTCSAYGSLVMRRWR